MRKCRNCGSTAQNKLIRTKYSTDGEKIVEVYKCGCGGYTMYEYRLTRANAWKKREDTE